MAGICTYVEYVREILYSETSILPLTPKDL